MISFSLSFLLAEAFRLKTLPLTLLGVLCGVAAFLVARHPKRWQQVGPAVIGAWLSFALPPPPALSAAEAVPVGPAELVGVVTGSLVELPEGAAIRVGGAVRVWIRGAHGAPFPGDLIRVVGRWNGQGRLEALDPRAVEVLTPAPWYSPARCIEFARRRLRDRMLHGLPPDVAAFMGALALGDASLPRDMRDDCASAGILHLVAVSGSHLGLVLAGLRLLSRHRFMLAGSIATYALLTGMEAPVFRSLVPALANIVAERLGRTANQKVWLFVSAAVVVAFDRTALESPGFQLSWCAFAALPEGQGGGMRTALVSGGRAFVGTTPILMWHFLRLPLLGIPAGLLLAPFIPCLLIASLALAVCGSHPLLVSPVTCTVRAFLALTDQIAALPCASLSVTRPDLTLVGVSIIACVLYAHGPPGSSRRTFGWLAGIAWVALFLPLPPPEGISVLPAGRGNATLVVEGHTVLLIDTGPPEAPLVDTLRKAGVTRIDAVLVTHADDDHSGGLTRILQAFRPRCVLLPKAAQHLLPRGAATLVAQRDRITLGGIRIDVAAPAPLSKAKGSNETGAIISVRAAGLTGVFVGDAEDQGLVEAMDFLPTTSDLLLLPHHGSEAARLADLLLSTQPRVVVASGRREAVAATTRIVATACGAVWAEVHDAKAFTMPPPR